MKPHLGGREAHLDPSSRQWRTREESVALVRQQGRWAHESWPHSGAGPGYRGRPELPSGHPGLEIEADRRVRSWPKAATRPLWGVAEQGWEGRSPGWTRRAWGEGGQGLCPWPLRERNFLFWGWFQREAAGGWTPGPLAEASGPGQSVQPPVPTALVCPATLWNRCAGESGGHGRIATLCGSSRIFSGWGRRWKCDTI